jgi:hypothetical protein
MAKHAAAQRTHRTHRTHTDPTAVPDDVVERRHEVGSEGFSGMVPGAVRHDNEEGARPDYYTEFGRKGLRDREEEPRSAEEDRDVPSGDRLRIEPGEDKGDRSSE